MVRDIVRRALLIWLGVAFLARPMVAQPGPDHRSTDHCRHQSAEAGPGGHHQTDPGACEHSDPCGDCATPSCNTATHCGASAAGLPAPDTDVWAAGSPDPVPSPIASFLVSRATAPPTHPPLFSR